MVAAHVTHPVYLAHFKGDAAQPETIRRRARDHAAYLVRKAARHALRGVVYGLNARGEEAMGPQEIPEGMIACSRCDLLTYRPDVCGFCAAELLGAA
ncbi:MAG TPA: hypothetical protein VI172_04060 [Candidatus Dormibacteraeota bacterium]|jgi:hypothetical protein